MAFANSLALISPSFPLHSSKNFTFSPKLPFRSPKIPLLILSCSSRKQAPSTEQEALKFIADSDGTTLPCVRTYENDLARLTLVGAVGFDQALTAAAADGGRAAAEHVDAGIPAMVIETVFPGSTAKNATVSTRLFLPARKVKEKAQKLKKSLSEDILAGTSSKNILAMTFRQVVMQKLWNFELVLFSPGTERDMDDLENPREVVASFTLSSSEESVISVLAEVVCVLALQSTERHFLDSLVGKTSSKFFQWFRKSNKVTSKDSSVVIYKAFEDEIVENAKSLLESFSSYKESLKTMDLRQKNYWWTPSMHSKLEKIGGHEFSALTSEFIPAYGLEVDANMLKDVKFEGGRKSDDNRWEVLLTHSQMVALADILDMYYEDVYSLPNKQLRCGVVANYNSLSKAKRSSSFLRIVSATIASGIFLITISTLSQFRFPHQHKGGKYPRESGSQPSSITESTPIQSINTEKLEASCLLVIQKIKDAFGWPGEISTETNLGAWIGEIPNYLKVPHQANSGGEDDSTNSADLEKINDDIKSSIQDVASYQVTLSSEGKLVGFQPTSRVGVNYWAVNPLAKELYGGRKLSPVGHITSFLHLSNKLAERGHKISFFLPTKLQSKFEPFNLHPNLITFIPVTIPHVNGLPPGTQTTADIPLSLQHLLLAAMDLTEPFIETSLRKLKPHFVFFDFTPWLPVLCQKLDIKSMFYYTISPATVGYLISPTRKILEKGLTGSDLMDPPPGFPSSSIKLRDHEARELAAQTMKEYDHGNNYNSFLVRQLTSLNECDAIGFKTCRETEGPYCDYIEKQFEKPVILAGPVLPEPPRKALDEKWEKLLSNFKAHTVIFCAFGSECVLNKNQFQELVLGLELTNLPFLVALKPPIGSETTDETTLQYSETGEVLRINHGKWKEFLLSPRA
ncbi:UDP-glucuronosyl/UDP-glucosyltransferase [Corchorus olitorius]|uniref:UDP-glucuronosyl/UDP-glucosyltransferase n=1 Tax=Corchorus olitorius TaxID=93759 RepID=A0A1R3H4I0_9ROSI|nr:UDP-glucuronosyl/UDP-glucosyltransferase [Corchorus olitorius]